MGQNQNQGGQQGGHENEKPGQQGGAQKPGQQTQQPGPNQQPGQGGENKPGQDQHKG